MPAPSRSRSRTPRRSFSRTPSRSRSRSRSPTPERTPRRRSRSPTPPPTPRGRTRSRSPRRRSHSRARSGSRTPSRSRSPSAPANSPAKTDFSKVTVSYEDFIAADEETPTFALEDATVDLIRTKVYQAAPLNKKFFNEIKKDRYMLAKDVNESLEPKPIPAQVVSSVGGFDLNKVHGGLLYHHKVSRLVQRPIWSMGEQLQRSRKYLGDAPPTQFDSPPFMGTGALPDGFVSLQYTAEDMRRHAALAKQNPDGGDYAELHERLGAHIKFHADAERSMQSMVKVIKEQQLVLGHMKDSLGGMWARFQDYINMARYQETHLKDMRRNQLVKAHTPQFKEWLETVYMKDKERLGDRDKSDEILAANYENVIQQYNEYRKHKNLALKSKQWKPRDSGRGNSSYDKNQRSGESSSYNRSGESSSYSRPRSDRSNRSNKNNNNNNANNAGSSGNSNNKSSGSRNNKSGGGRNNTKKDSDNKGKTA